MVFGKVKKFFILPPPPLHMPAAPNEAFFDFKIFKSVTTILQPDDPIGWPQSINLHVHVKSETLSFK